MAHSGQIGGITLKESQKDIIRRAWGRRRVLVLAPPGEGKTLVALSLFHFYKTGGHLKKLLVFAHAKGFEGYPKDNHFGFSMKTYRTKDDLEKLIRFPNEVIAQADVHVVLTSVIDDFYVGMFPGEGAKTQRQLVQPSMGLTKLAPLFDFVVLDEIHRYRTQENKTNHTLAQFFRIYRGMFMGMTATMFYTSSLDTFQIMQYVDNAVFPSYWGFYEEFVDYRWKTLRQKKVMNGRSVWMDTDVREKLGNKNMDRLFAKLAPYLIEVKDTRWTFNWKVIPYNLSADEGAQYTKFVGGLGLLDKLMKFTMVDPATDKKKVVTYSQKDLITAADGNQYEAKAFSVGSYVTLPKMERALVVRKIDWVEDEVAFSARLPVLQRYLSMTREKVTWLYRILQKDGCLVYCQFHSTAKALAVWAKKIWPDRKVSVLTGQTTDVGKKIRGHDRNEIIFCTKAITESLNFYFHQIAIYESITNPGMLEQFVGRASRSDADYSELDVMVFVGTRTIDAYFWERLVANTNSIETNRFYGALPHSPDWEWIREYSVNGTVSFPVLKKLLLWQGTQGEVTEDDIAPQANDGLDVTNLRQDAGRILTPEF